MQARAQARLLLPILAVLYVLGFTNLFLRSSFGIMAPHLALEMELAPWQLSAVASAFFVAYALMQVPTGMLLDRFGARRTLATMLLFTAAGAALFAAAQSATMLAAGRVLMGLGCAGVFTGAFYVLALWLPRDRVVSASGNLNGFAGLGNLAATTPLALLIALIGWRDSYWLFTAGVVVLLLAVAIVLRDAPPDAPPRASGSESLGQIVAGVRAALAQPGMGRLLVAGFPMSAGAVFSGAWGAHYLRDVHGLDDLWRGNVLLGFALCAICGHVVSGQVARRANSMRAAIVAGSLGVVVATGALALLPAPPLWLVATLLALLAVSATYPAITMAHARGLVPAHLMGRGVAVTNMGVMSAVATMQLAFGWVIGLFTPVAGLAPEIAYRAAFGVQAVVALAALAVYAGIEDVRAKD